VLCHWVPSLSFLCRQYWVGFIMNVTFDSLFVRNRLVYKSGS
jgi:hypothetical protein